MLDCWLYLLSDPFMVVQVVCDGFGSKDCMCLAIAKGGCTIGRGCRLLLKLNARVCCRRGQTEIEVYNMTDRAHYSVHGVSLIRHEAQIKAGPPHKPGQRLNK